MRKKILALFLLIVLMFPNVLGIAFAAEDVAVEFPTSDSDFDPTADSIGYSMFGSTWELLKQVYGKEEEIGDGDATKRQGFFWSHDVTVNSGTNYSLFSGAWGAHPAIFISILSEAQQSIVPTPDDYSFLKNGLWRYSDWSAEDNMSMNYWLALAQFFTYDSDKYKLYEEAKNGEINAYITLKKKEGGEYRKVNEVKLLIASNTRHVNALLEVGEEKRFYKTPGLSADPLTTGSPHFYNDYIKNEVSARPASNAVLFYNLDNEGEYQVSIDIRVSYTGEDGGTYGESVFKSVDNGGITKAFHWSETDGVVQSSLYGYSIQGNGKGKLTLKNLGSATNKVRALDAAQYVDRGVDISSSDPLAIMTDISLITTSPGTKTKQQQEDTEKLSTVFKLLRTLAACVCVFGMMGAILRIAAPDVSGFAQIRFRMALDGWVGLALVIGFSISILSLLVEALFLK